MECTAESCDQRARAQGMCMHHYSQARRNGLPLLPREVRDLPRNARGDAELLRGVWRAMHGRCRSDDERWGGRGITVCAEWNDYSAFRSWAIAAGYQLGLTIDRIDNDGPYGPENCRWATATQQSRNRRNVHQYEYQGESKTLADWADDPRCEVSYKCLYQRVKKGWEFERSLVSERIGGRWAAPDEQIANERHKVMLTAFGETKSLLEWITDPRCAITESALRLRVNRRGWDHERAITTPPVLPTDRCPQGHLFTPENTYHHVGGRRCRTCRIARSLETYRERKAKMAREVNP